MKRKAIALLSCSLILLLACSVAYLISDAFFIFFVGMYSLFRPITATIILLPVFALLLVAVLHGKEIFRYDGK